MTITQKLLRTGLGVMAFIMLPVFTMAQTDPGCDPLCPCPKGCRSDGVTCCPIDSGVWILLSFGMLYGLFMVYKLKKNKVKIQAS